MSIYTEVSVLVPTRGRPDQLRRMISSFYQTTEWVAELVFRVDDDDRETQAILRAFGEVYITGPRLEGYKSLPVFFNELAAHASGDVLMCGNDDMIFKTEGWDTIILDQANCYPDGIFDFGYATHNAPNFPFATVSKQVVKELGFLFDPRIFWGDIYLRDVMAHFGRAMMIDDLEIEHDWMGHKPDKTFTDGNDTRFTNQNAMHSTAVCDAIKKLEAALAARGGQL
jgi:glycosyltransferase involved in cell wall biosynthesis